MSIVVRRADIADLDALVPLFDAYRVFYQQDSDPATARDFLDARLRRGESVILLAERDRTRPRQRHRAHVATFRHGLETPRPDAPQFDMRGYASDFAALTQRRAQRQRRGQPPAAIDPETGR
ncbi:MAG: hypothetical protein ACR2J7_09720 [Luteimonas sp.]